VLPFLTLLVVVFREQVDQVLVFFLGTYFAVDLYAEALWKQPLRLNEVYDLLCW
jgi:hypothetical protein